MKNIRVLTQLRGAELHKKRNELRKKFNFQEREEDCKFKIRTQSQRRFNIFKNLKITSAKIYQSECRARAKELCGERDD